MNEKGDSVVSLGASHLTANADADQADFSLPAPDVATVKQHNLWATHYFVYAASASPDGIPFVDKAGNPISDNVSQKDWCLAAIEGTVQVSMNGKLRTLNYGGTRTDAQVDCAAVLGIDPAIKPWITKTGHSYFRAAVGKYGDGGSNYRLIPFRTVAVDKNVFPFGTVFFIPDAKGVSVTLPSGRVVYHDGYFFAADTGGAIKGNHIDVFCGTSAQNCFPGFITSNSDKTFVAMEISDAAVKDVLEAMHAA
ncbi:3D domain-containing protein [Achromobacter sp. UBA4530]|uniref:3D domain-containing protein n=1 Tax=Achromobacter sp. UBA4530 TaxID=1945912 RepID=UPI00257F3E9D|nr:3D domain-containing protein [Achromobacter sp. UBA4530]